MPTYIVQCVAPDKKKAKIVREAPEKQIIIDTLLAQNYSIISIEESSETEEKFKVSMAQVKDLFRKRDYSGELSIATRQLATLLGAGITMAEALHILIDSGGKKDPLKEPFRAILKGINEGKRIDKVMEQYPDIFSPHYRGIVCLGMNTGALTDAFDSLADDLEKEVGLRKKISAAMTYPAVTFTLSFLLNVALFVLVLPKIVVVISDLEVTLPLITRILMTIMDYLCNPYLVAISICAIVFIMYQVACYVSTPVGKYNYDFIKLRLPVVGYINRCRYAERLCRSLGLLMQYSVPIQEAVFITGRICNNSFMEQKLIYPIIDAVSEGVFIAEAMKSTGLMPMTSVNLISAGEATGDVVSCMKNAAGMIELDLTSALQRALTLLEPLMIVFMSLFVLAIVLAVMLPIYQIIQNFGM